MSSARRYDAAPLTQGLSRDKRGFLVCPAYVTRTGVLTYRRADGTVVRELRHPDQVFRADSLETLRSAPVTVGHPDDGLTWVDPANADKLEVGVVQDAAAHEGKYVRSSLNVRRADAIRRIDAQELVEVSAAYEADIDPTPGVYEGQEYHQQQTNIVYNHVALLPKGKGRCGSDVRLRADAGDAIIQDEAQPSTQPDPAEKASEERRADDAREAPAAAKEEGESMTTRKIRVDGVECELPDTTASLVEKVVQDRDAHKKRADTAEAQAEMIKADLDKARDAKTIQAYVAQRVELERAAAKVVGAEQRFDGLSDRELRVKVLSVVSPEFKTEARSDDAITAAFDYAIANASKTNQGLKLVGEAIRGSEPVDTSKRADAIDFAKEFAELEAKRQNAWKPQTKGGN